MPAPDGTIFCEAEKFHPVEAAAEAEVAGWQAKPRGENYYAATFANIFFLHKTFVGAPEDCEGTVAMIIVLTNQNGAPIKGLKVTLNIDAPTRAALAGGGVVTKVIHQGKREYTLGLDVADVLVLR